MKHGEGKKPPERPRRRWKITLKWIFKKLGVRMWTEFRPGYGPMAAVNMAVRPAELLSAPDKDSSVGLGCHQV
jgi:hypothetical protein